jgi:hypothetical protein
VFYDIEVLNAGAENTSDSQPRSLEIPRFQSNTNFPPNTDHVCGSAHALLTPYYTSKRRARSEEPSSQPAPNLELHARQVSKRGGDLRVVWDEERGIVKIAGEVVRTGGGSWVYKSVDKYDLGTYVYKDGWKASYRW